VAALHDGPCHQANVFATGSAAQNARARLEAERLAHNAAPWAGEPITPAGLFEISSARRVIRENALKFRQRLGEGQVFAGQDIDAHH